MASRSTVRDGMRIDWDVPIKMDDDVILQADVFRPDDEDTHPVIVSHGPYGKGLRFQEGYPSQWQRIVERFPEVLAGSSNKYQNWETADPEKWVPDGYVCVRIDSRGAANSPGHLQVWSPREANDLYECIEWAGTQPWSNGKVGLSGISYYAMNQWQVAGLKPPHLAAICPWEGAADFLRDVYYHGGIRTTNWRNFFTQQVTSVQHGVGQHGPVNPNTGEFVAGLETLSDEELARNRSELWDEIVAHPLADDYYVGRSADWPSVEVPFLSAGNWGGQALHLRGNVEAFARAGSKQKWLEIHGEEHWTLYYTDYGIGLQKQFFDYFLKGENNGWDKQPPVILQIRTTEGFFERHEYEWPLARTRWSPLYLSTGDRTLRWEPDDVSQSVSFDAMGDGITLTSPPLEQQTEITGPVAARLYVSSSTADADLFLALRLFRPDGTEVFFQGSNDPKTVIGKGWLRASHRKLDPQLSTRYRPYHTHDEVQPLTPGDVYEVDVEIWPTCIVIPAGYRLALTILGRDFDHGGTGAELKNFLIPLRGSGPYVHDDPEDRPLELFGGTTTIHTGSAYAAHMLLPVVPAASL